MIDLTCANPSCRKPFRAPAWEVKHGRRYCSRKCGGEDLRGPKRYNYKGKVKKICPICGGEFERSHAAVEKQTYCSPRCGSISRRREPPMKTVVCKGCGEEFEAKAYVKRTFCTMLCYQGWRKGYLT